jgi:hypothetical protein
MRNVIFQIVLFPALLLGIVPATAQQVDSTALDTLESGPGGLLPDSGATGDFPPPEKPLFVPDSVEQPEIDPDTITIAPESDSTSVLLSVPYDDTATGVVPESRMLEPDTSYRFWSDPFRGVGIGWSLGGMPIYELWQGGLIDQASGLPAFTDWVDSIPIRFNEITAPDEYHTAFPIGVTLVPVVSENRYSAIDLDFQFMTKTQELSWESDSISVDFWNRTRKLRYFDGAIGLTTHLGIRPRYFSVKGVDRTSLLLGASFCPLSAVWILREDTSPFLDTAYSATNMYYGLGASWKAGISTLRQTSPGRGLEIGTMYTGFWRGSYTGERDLIRGLLNPRDPNAFDVVRFVTHRFHLYVRLLFGKKPPKTEPPQAPTASPTDTTVSDTSGMDTLAVDPVDDTAPPDSLPPLDTTDSPPDTVPPAPRDTIPPHEPTGRLRRFHEEGRCRATTGDGRLIYTKLPSDNTAQLAAAYLRSFPRLH